jgi:hypothetical protein
MLCKESTSRPSADVILTHSLYQYKTLVLNYIFQNLNWSTSNLLSYFLFYLVKPLASPSSICGQNGFCAERLVLVDPSF